VIKKVLAIVIDYNTYQEAVALTRQLLQPEVSNGFALGVVYVDNGNKIPVDLPLELKSAVHLLRVEKNEGYASGLMAAIEAFKEFDAFWFLNSDLEIEPDALPKLVKVLNEHEDVAAVGPRVYKARTGKVWGARGVVNPITGSTAMADVAHSGVLPKWSYIPGCSLLIRRSAYEQVGGLPLEYRMYFEETELCVKLQKAGWKLWVQVDAIVYHAVKSLEKGVPARHFAYYFTRNNLHFWNKNFGIPWPLQLPRMGFVVAKEVALPLRRAKSLKELEDRLLYLGAGIIDAIPFTKGRSNFDKKLFPR